MCSSRRRCPADVRSRQKLQEEEEERRARTGSGLCEVRMQSRDCLLRASRGRQRGKRRFPAWKAHVLMERRRTQVCVCVCPTTPLAGSVREAAYHGAWKRERAMGQLDPVTPPSRDGLCWRLLRSLPATSTALLGACPMPPHALSAHLPSLPPLPCPSSLLVSFADSPTQPYCAVAATER